jgi:2-C-methyl-D-erythritol 4-phosphate cytidylyltransferase
VGAWAVVVAAGSGSRFGGPKQYEALAGRRVLDWALDVVRGAVDGIVLVVGPERVDDPEPGADRVVAGGASRSASVRNGLALVPDTADVVLVHDAARPLATPALAEAVIAAVRDGADAAVPGVAVADTVKQVDEAGRVVATLDRAALVAVQTPQAFRAGALRAAHASAAEATDDAALVESAGGMVVVVPGELENAKITEAADLPLAAARLERRS